jgi:hypothetical protein
MAAIINLVPETSTPDKHVSLGSVAVSALSPAMDYGRLPRRLAPDGKDSCRLTGSNLPCVYSPLSQQFQNFARKRHRTAARSLKPSESGPSILAGAFMRTVAEYRIPADKCRELANLITTPTEKKILEEMAQSWEKLADLRKRDREPEGEVGGQVARRGRGAAD